MFVSVPQRRCTTVHTHLSCEIQACILALVTGGGGGQDAAQRQITPAQGRRICKQHGQSSGTHVKSHETGSLISVSYLPAESWPPKFHVTCIPVLGLFCACR